MYIVHVGGREGEWERSTLYSHVGGKEGEWKTRREEG